MQAKDFSSIPVGTYYKFPYKKGKCQCLYRLVERSGRPSDGSTIEIVKDCGSKDCRNPHADLKRQGRRFTFHGDFKVVPTSYLMEALKRLET